MKLTNILGVSTLALTAIASQAFAADTASEAVYNPATVVDVVGTVTSIRQVSAGAPLAGLHATVQLKTGAVDVYLGPPDFLSFLKASFKAGERLEVVGSRVKSGNSDVILTRQVDDGFSLITLRDPNGVADWQNWGQEIDPALVQ